MGNFSEVNMEPPVESHSKNLDVKCLRCGAVNIPDNHICGRCGASLPLVYGREGEVLRWEESRLRRFDAFLKHDAKRKWNPNTSRWILRIGILLFALFIAFYILHR